MELNEFRQLISSSFGMGEEHLHMTVQTLEDKPTQCARWDTKEYPWPIFAQFLRDVPRGVRIVVNQRVDVTKFWLSVADCFDSEPHIDSNFETKITTSFLFYKVF